MQMEEKTMVADTLTGINGELVRFGEMIAQTENKELKQTLKQFRNACEQSQEELYQIAREKSYYVPAAKATQAEIDHVKSLFSSHTLKEKCSINMSKKVPHAGRSFYENPAGELF